MPCRYLLFIIFLLRLAHATRDASRIRERASAPSLCNNTHFVPGIPGGFTQRSFTDFSGLKPGEGVAGFLSSYGFQISDYSVKSVPIAHNFSQNNVLSGNGTLDLKVNTFIQDSVLGAEIVTRDLFQYASVRTVLKSSNTPGVVQGNFFYLNDTQEIDWEILTSTISAPSACVPAGLWAINHGTAPSTHRVVKLGFDITADFHEYRIDWTGKATTFYLDGQKTAQLTTNVPTSPGRWIWNAWSSGDPCWSNGPPLQDSVTQIRSIEILKGYDENLGGDEDSCKGSVLTATATQSSASSTGSNVNNTNVPKTSSSQGYLWNPRTSLLVALWFLVVSVCK